jgi:hypothetical protein
MIEPEMEYEYVLIAKSEVDSWERICKKALKALPLERRLRLICIYCDCCGEDKIKCNCKLVKDKS